MEREKLSRVKHESQCFTGVGIDQRYVISQILHDGTKSKIFKIIDSTDETRPYAIKIYMTTGDNEIDVLKNL